ncbi:MAG: rod shape-determining protein RodA [Bacteroidia bacterium]
MRGRENSIFYGIDRLTILIYVIMVILGWLNIYAAVYDEDHKNIFDISQKYGKQLLWIGSAGLIAFAILLTDTGFFTTLSYLIFAMVFALNILVVFLGKEIKGSHSWFRFGDFGLQPAEFFKFAINLALAKFLSGKELIARSVFRLRLKEIIKNYRNTVIALAIIIVPAAMVKVLQDETGLAIVFVAFIVVLYREGMSVTFLLIGMLSVTLFVLALVVSNMIFLVIALVIISAFLFIIFRKNQRNTIYILLFFTYSVSLIYGSNYAYNQLKPHQKNRIDVLLRPNKDLKGVGYNVDQAKIAIGSGGMWGKGYLQGTQTKYDFVPEQETDFIFCTVGEEWGFMGSATVVFLQLFLILRLVFLAERQRSAFSRIYGYGVASILFFHLAVNIGMTIGLMPVIGIPLPFFSYGGSSLWSFTILLFIFLKLDANRLLILR